MSEQSEQDKPEGPSAGWG